MNIHFGTSGWRSIIAKDFTFENVEVVSYAIAQHLLARGGKSVVIGYDTRFLSNEFAKTSAKIFAAYGIKSYFSLTDIPTPVIAYLTVTKKTDGAINITASHNDPYYNGIKFSSKSGGPALPEETEDIEKRINKFLKNRKTIKKMLFEKAVEKKLIIPFNENEYTNAIKKLIDFTPIKKKRPKIIYDPFFATGIRYLPKILKEYTDFTMIHGKKDVLFGGLHPEPTGENLDPLIKKVKSSKADLGLATDGDADRFGIIDFDGSYISPNMVLPIIYYYFLTERGINGNAVRTVATTHLIDKISEHFGYYTKETPVGFKYIGDAIMKGEAVFGGEESGGASMKGWLADKDGILVDLLVTEIFSRRKKPMKELFKELTDKFGDTYSKRLDFEYKGDRKTIERKLKNTVKTFSKEMSITKINELDGTKIILTDKSWILFRFSGTEPKIRIYAESDNEKKFKTLLEKGEEIIQRATF